MCGNSGVVVATGVFIWLAFDLAVVALFAPFWYTFEFLKNDYSKGLVLECEEPFGDSDDRNCEWTMDDEWGPVEYGDNFRVVQILWIAATGLFGLAALWSFFLCCERFHNRCCPALAMVICLVATGAVGAAVGLFAYDNNNKFDRDDEEGYYDWAYYVAIATGAAGLIATILAAISIAKIRKTV